MSTPEDIAAEKYFTPPEDIPSGPGWMDKEFIHTWAMGQEVSYKEIINWDGTIHCQFCGKHWSKGKEPYILLLPMNLPTEILCCPRCKEFKGLEPCITRICQWRG